MEAVLFGFTFISQTDINQSPDIQQKLVVPSLSKLNYIPK